MLNPGTRKTSHNERRAVTLRNATSIAIAFLLLAGASLAQADSRFENGDGGALGGEGSLGQGSVTIHHNLLPEERTEIDNVISTQRSQLDSTIVQQRSELNSEIAALRALINKMRSDHAAEQAALRRAIDNKKVDASSLTLSVVNGTSHSSCPSGTVMIQQGLRGDRDTTPERAKCAQIVNR